MNKGSYKGFSFKGCNRDTDHCKISVIVTFPVINLNDFLVNEYYQVIRICSKLCMPMANAVFNLHVSTSYLMQAVNAV